MFGKAQNPINPEMMKKIDKIIEESVADFIENYTVAVEEIKEEIEKDKKPMTEEQIKQEALNRAGFETLKGRIKSGINSQIESEIDKNLPSNPVLRGAAKKLAEKAIDGAVNKAIDVAMKKIKKEE